MAEHHTFVHLSTSGTHVVEADPDSLGIYRGIRLVRLVVNGGTAGAIALWESNDSDVDATGTDTMIADVDPQSGVPIVLDYDLYLKGNLLVVLAANTDVTVVLDRLP